MQNNNNYDMNIENSRSQDIQNMNINHNPYVNQNLNNQNTNNANNTQGQNTFSNNDFLKGALIGAAVTFLLTNKGAQDSLMKAASKGSELFQAGIEELKERYEDARAQMESNQE
ncbi:MAG: YtxH domain-containing protein [Arcobacter sp.]|nr:YtxH domain-containing protein [Arcobacter sp.]